MTELTGPNGVLAKTLGGEPGAAFDTAFGRNCGSVWTFYILYPETHTLLVTRGGYDERSLTFGRGRRHSDVE